MEDFGQSISLTSSIKSILRSYPEGTSILKELIQNADDARARNVTFVLDSRSLGTSRLLYPSLAKFQGPALVCSNDAEFTAEDFESIRRIGESLKTESSMGVKTGRFGIGFNSVYHLTDLPSFVSGKYLTMFDPHMDYLEVTTQNPGKRLDFVTNKSHAVNFADQFQGYKMFGCNMTDEYHGTLFRFPLRNEETAASSRISERVHNVESMRSLLTGAFYDEISCCVLFLKHIERIQVFEISSESVEANPQLLFECGLRFNTSKRDAALWPDIPRDIDSASCLTLPWTSFAVTREEMERNRCAMVTAITQQTQRQLQKKPGSSREARSLIQWQETPLPIDFLMCLRLAKDGNETLQFWILCNQLGGPGASMLASQASERSSIRLVPWAGVAGCLGTYSVDGTNGSLNRLEEQAFVGRAFCFLPLPTLTNLPVHVNGYFELSSNRRDIWSGKDMEGDGAMRAQWNETLLSNIVSSCYVRMLDHLRPILGFSTSYMRFFPSAQLVTPWNLVQRCLFSACSFLPFVFTRAADFSRSSVVEEKTPKASSSLSSFLFGNQKEESKSQAVRRPYLGRWINCKEAFVVDAKDALMRQDLAEFLQEIGSPVCLMLDDRLVEVLLANEVMFGAITPEYVRRTIRDIVDRPVDANQTKALRFAVSNVARDCIVLKYVLVGLFDFSLKRPINAGLSELDKLPLIPLANRSIGIFRVEPTDKDFVSKIAQLVQMGYTETLASAHLKAAKGDINLAMSNLLSASESNNPPTSTAFSEKYIWIRDSEVRTLFSAAGRMLVDVDALPLVLRDVFENEAALSVINVRHLLARHMLDIIPECCPPTWRNQSLVTWLNEQHPTREWVQLLWGYLSRNQQALDCLIEQDIPIIPTLSAEMCNLSRRSVLFLPTAVCPDLVVSLLRKSGAKILDQSVISSLVLGNSSESGRLREIIFDDSASGVLRAIATLSRGIFLKSKGDRTIELENSLFEQWNIDERVALRTFLAKSLRKTSNSLSAEEILVLRTLPVFEVFNGSPEITIYISLKGNVKREFSGTSSRLVNFDCKSLLTLEDESLVHNDILRDSFIRKIDEDTASLLTSLECRRMNSKQFYLEYFLPRMSEVVLRSDTEAINWRNGLVSLFLHASSISNSDRDFMSKLSQCACVEVRSVDSESKQESSLRFNLRVPSECFDPTVGEISSLLDADELPIEDLCRLDILGILRVLGIRNSLGVEAVVRIARKVSSVTDRKLELAVSLAKVLFQFVIVHDRELFDSQFISEAEHRKEANEELLQQASAKNSFSSLIKGIFVAQPTRKSGSKERLLARIQANSTMISAAIEDLSTLRWIPVLPTLSNDFLPYLDCCKENDGCFVMSPPCCCLISEICKCSSSFGAIDGQPTSLMCRFFNWNDEVSAIVAAKQLCCLSDGFIRRYSAESDNSKCNEEKEALASTVPQLLHIMQKHASNATCMLAVSEILSNKNWVWIGTGFVRPCDVAFRCEIDTRPYLCEIPRDLLVFRKIFQQLGVRDEFSTTDYTIILEKLSLTPEGKQKCALPVPLLNMAVAVVQFLSDRSMDVKDLVIMVPDDKSFMGRSCDMVFHDAPWLSRTNHDHALTSCRFVHPKISANVAEKVGCLSLRASVLRDLGNMTLLESASSKGREAFGQSESLTRRLRNILEIYPEVSIIGEMIQNADDSGASTVKIIHSKKQFGTSSLMSGTMSSWQGEALYFYNDSQFSEDDFHHISKIGQGSKLDRMSVTGRFGLGFNSVYHITDLPSFVSGDHIVFLDPHLAYVPGAKSDKPGIRIHFTNSQLQTIFPDQFEPFKLLGCDMLSRFNGTLFRFPVRQGDMGKRSEISSNSFSTVDISKLLQEFCREISSYLVFMRHVKKIEVYSLNDDGNIVLNGISSSLLPLELLQQAISIEEFATPTKADFQRLISGSTSKDAFYSQLRSIPNNNVLRFTEIKRIVVRQENGTLESSRFIVSSGVGGKSVVNIACDAANRELKLLPIGSVAVNISEVGVVNRTGKLYCYLPLPVRVSLPVHINSYFELSANRRDIWYGDDMKSGIGKAKSDWNVALLQDLIAPLYVVLMQFVSTSVEVSSDIEIRKSAVASLWPNEEVASPWSNFLQVFHTTARSVPLLWSGIRGGRWSACKDTYIISSSPSNVVEEEKNQKSDEDRIHDILSMEEISVCILSQKTVRSLAAFNCTAGEVNAAMLRRHFRKSDCPHPSIDRPANVLFLLQAIVSDHQIIPQDKFANEFIGIPLIPTTCGESFPFQPISSPPISTASLLVAVFLSWTRNLTVMRLIVSDCFFPAIALNTSSLALDFPLIQVPEAIHSFLNSKIVSSNTNIKRMTSSTFSSLFLSIIPPEWKIGSRFFVVQEEILQAKLSLDWNFLFWRVLHEFRAHNDKVSMDNIAPIVPCVLNGIDTVWVRNCRGLILDPSNMLQLPVQINDVIRQLKIPVLYRHSFLLEINSAALPNDSEMTLSSLSNRITRESDNAHDLILSELRQFALPVSPLCFLCCLANCSKINGVGMAGGPAEWIRRLMKGVIEKYSSAHIDCLRQWITNDSEIRKILSDKEEHKSAENVVFWTPETVSCTCLTEMLRNLPVWPYLLQESDSGEAATIFRCISSSDMIVPDGEVSRELIFDHFVILHGQSDASLLELIGMKRQSKLQFYANVCVPKLCGNTILLRDDGKIRLILDILGNLEALERQFPDVLDQLKNSSIVPCYSDEPTQFFKACELFDPNIKDMHELIPQRMFPSLQFQQIAIIQSLRKLGIRQSIDCHGVIVAASRIQEIYEDLTRNWHKNGTADVKRNIDKICESSCRLFQFIDSNVDKFLNEADSDSFKSLIECEESSNEDRAFSSALGGLFGQSLRSIKWIPAHHDLIMSDLPPITNYDSKYPFRLLLVSSMESRPSEDICLCSSSLYCLSETVNNSHTKLLLGWGDKLPTSVLCKQLLALASNNQSLVARSFIAEYALQIYQNLSQRSSEYSDIQCMREALHNRDWVWDGEKFVSEDRIVLKFDSSMYPKLYYFISVLPNQLKECSSLFESNGVRNTFLIDDIASMLFSWVKEFGTSVLPIRQAEAAIDALNMISNFSGEEISRFVRSLRERNATTNKITLGVGWTYIPVPNDESVLIPSHEIIFSDAPWMLEFYKRTMNSSSSRKLSVCHPQISEKIALALNLRRLRDTLLEADVVSLPDLSGYFDDQNVPIRSSDIVSDLINVADRLGCTKLTFVADCCSYSNCRLVHPMLSNFCNHSLIVVMEGCSISQHNLVHLFAPQLDSYAEFFDGKPVLGVGLSSLFRYSSCVEVLSGTKYYVVDGRGDVMVRPSQGKLDQKRSQIHAFTFGTDSNLYEQFNDQFLTFDNIRIGETNTVGKLLEAKQAVPAVIVRIPVKFTVDTASTLESKESELKMENSSVFLPLQSLLGSWKALASVGIVCSRNIGHLELNLRKMKNSSLIVQSSADDGEIDNISLVRYWRTTPAVRDMTNRMCQNVEWKKRPGLFSSSYKPISEQFVTDIAIDESGWETYCSLPPMRFNRRRWMICSFLGGGRTHDLARDSFGSQDMVPLMSIAVDVTDSCFCNASVLPELGFLGMSSLSSGVRMHLHVPLFFNPYSRSVILNRDIRGIESRMCEKMMEWNKSVLMHVYRELIAVVFVNIKALCGNNETSLYKYWPYSNSFSEELRPVILESNVYVSLAGRDLFWNSEKRQFFKAADCYFIGKSSTSNLIGFFTSEINLFRVPYEVGMDLLLARIAVRVLTPDNVRKLLLRASRRMLEILRRDPILVLDCLAYCLSDTTTPSGTIDLAIPEGERIEKWRSLTGIPLVLLENQEIGVFQREGSTIFSFIVCDDRCSARFPALANVIVSRMVFDHQGTRSFFRDNLFLRSLNFASLSPAIMSTYMDRLLPASWKGCDFVQWDPENGFEHPPKRLICTIWSIFSISDPSTINAFSEWPLLPCNNQVLASCKRIRDILVAYDRDNELCDLLRDSLISKPTNGSSLSIVEVMPTVSQDFEWMSRLGKSQTNLIGEADFRVRNTREAVASPSSQPVLATSISAEITDAMDENMTIAAGQFRDIMGNLVSVGVPVLQNEYFRLHDVRTLLPTTCLKLCSRVIQSLSSLHKNRVSISFQLLTLVKEYGILSLNSCPDVHSSAILQFIVVNNRSSVEGLDSRDMDNLKHLPLFLNSVGKRVALNQEKSDVKYCLLSNDKSILGITIPDISKELILHNDTRLTDLYKQMNVPNYSLIEVLIRLVLPNFASLTPIEQIKTLDVVRENWTLLKANQEMMDILKATEFVPTISEGVALLVKPSSLFSWMDSNMMEIFISDQRLFPVVEIRTEEWHDILSDLGLKTCIDGDTLIILAKSTHDNYEAYCRRNTGHRFADSPDYQAILKRGEYIALYLTGSVDSIRLFNNKAFVDKISKLSIVPAKMCKSIVAGGYFEIIDILAPFCQSYLPAKKELVFTTAVILKESCIPPMIWHSKFEIIAEPKVDIVLSHFGNLIRQQNLDQWNYVESIETVFMKIFIFLRDNWTKIEKSTKTAFKNLNCIPVGYCLVKPCRVFLRMTENLSPFMFEVPRCFGSELDQLFSDLGVRQQPNFNDYSIFLSELHDEMGQLPLNPNELVAVLSVLSLLAESMPSEVDSLRGGIVYVPDEDYVLRDSKYVYVLDDIHLRNRVKVGPYSAHVSPTRNVSGSLYIMHPDVKLNVRRIIGIKNLSEVVVERVDSGFLRQSLVNRVESVQDDELTKQLHSEDLCNLLTQIMLDCRAISSISASESKTDASRRLRDEIATKLSKSVVVGVPAIQSRHFIKSENSALIDVSGCLTGSLFLLETMGDNRNCLLISRSLIPQSLDSSFVISMALTKLVNLPVHWQAAVSALIRSTQTDRSAISSLFGISSDPMNSIIRGDPGGSLADIDKKLLDYKPLRQYSNNEIVAYRPEGSDGNFRYATVVKVEVDDSDDGTESKSDRFSAVRRITARISATELRTFLSTDLYSFKKARDCEELNKRSSESIITSISSSISGMMSTSINPTNTPSSVAKSQATSNLPPVSSVEYLAALRTLMSMAGIDYSPERDNLIGQVVELQRNNVAMSIERDQVRTQLDKSRQDVEGLRQSLMCGICMGADVDTVLNPCGHVICGACARNLRGRTCPWCRKEVTPVHMLLSTYKAK